MNNGKKTKGRDIISENDSKLQPYDCSSGQGTPPAGDGPRTLGIRAAILFFNFLLIVMALYQLKPASRSLFIESLGAERLPYVWIATALAMGAVTAVYYRLVGRQRRIRVVLGSCLLFGALLVAFRLLLARPGPVATTLFYVFVDILGVVLVEQFWSLTNAIYSTRQGKSWYGVIGTGGLLGGVLGGGLAALLINHTPLTTPDLLLVAAAILAVTFALTWIMGRLGLYREVEGAGRPVRHTGGWRAIRESRYLLLIAALLLLAQLASPLIEYQFLTTVEAAYPELEARTAFLSLFFSLLGLVSIAVNLAVTPLVHRHLGVIAGLLVQPLLIAFCSLGFWLQPALLPAAAAKISDRGLSYSINRASKELLYIPIDTVLIYQAKAWIDMFGYRLFKIFGSLLILLCTRWLPVRLEAPQLSWFSVAICAAWIGLILVLRADYGRIAGEM